MTSIDGTVSEDVETVYSEIGEHKSVAVGDLQRCRSDSSITLPYQSLDVANSETASTQRLINPTSEARRRKLCLAAIGLVLLIAVGITLGLVLGSGSNETANDPKQLSDQEEQRPSATTSTFAPTIPTSSISVVTDDKRTSMKSTTSTFVETTIVAQTSPGSTPKQQRPETYTPSHTTTNAQSGTTGMWTGWGPWSSCTATCGPDVQTRYRSCSRPLSSSFDCTGRYVEKQEVLNKDCPGYGVWDDWAAWGKCNATCGGGVHTRARNCSVGENSEMLCAGPASQIKECATWDCLDTGNAATCDTGVKGIIVTESGIAISDAKVLEARYPPGPITYTDQAGNFALNSTCASSTLIISKAGFVDTNVSVGNASYVELRQIEMPYFQEEPQTKARIIGDNVTFCCSATGDPGILYYEWFRNSKLLDNSLYSRGGDSLSIANVSLSSAGLYHCRASTGHSAISSTPARLVVHETEGCFCEQSLTPRRIHLPDDCVQAETNTATYEVGDCLPTLCTRKDVSDTETCRDDTFYCCGIQEHDLIDVACSGYTLKLIKIKSCGCRICNDDHTSIVGTVYFHPSMEVVKHAEVNLNGKLLTYTDVRGRFKVRVRKEQSNAIVTIKDSYDKTRSTTKVIDISEGSFGTIFTSIFLITESHAITFQASQNTTLFIGKDVSNPDTSVAKIHLASMSFIDRDFKSFSGYITTTVRFLNAAKKSDFDIYPGILSTTNNNGNDNPLLSKGAFWISFTDSNSSEPVFLKKRVKVFLLRNSNIIQDMLWKLDTNDGRWNKLNYDLDFSDGNIGQLDRHSQSTWINIASASTTYRYCFFKVMSYESEHLQSEISSSLYPIFVRTIYSEESGISETRSHTFFPSDNCFQIQCTGNSGYIEVWISDYEYRQDEYLFPAYPNNSRNIGMDEDTRETISYNVNVGDEHMGVKLVSSPVGPFFENRTSCLAYSGIGNHFKFFFSGMIENVYTFKNIFDLSPWNIKASQEVSKRVWYQNRYEGHRACYVKAKLILTRQRNITVRVFSYGGTLKDIESDILGIRKTQISTTTSVCIEFKCSGSLSVPDEQNIFDYTKVDVIPLETAVSSCHVQNSSTRLLDVQKQFNGTFVNRNKFTFIAPLEYGPELGIYSGVSDSGDIESARTIAIGECQSGKTMEMDHVNLDIGIAATFLCD